MTLSGWVEFLILFAAVIAITPVLGAYMARVYTGERVLLERVLGPVERGIYRVIRTDVKHEQDWKRYAASVMLFSLAGWLLLYLLLRTQTLWNFTGLNPEHFKSAPWNVTFNTATSFLTNTNWQYYAGETTMSYFSQMAGLTVQNFVSAAVGICVAIALIRGIAGRSGKGLGNFWQDLVRTILYVLLPISVIGALVLISQGVIQTFGHYLNFTGVTGMSGHIAVGPVASQEVIKNLGTNGGGFFNTNAAHPFENPNGLTNVLEPLLILMIPAALTATYGKMVGSRRQGWAIFGAMSVLFIAGFAVLYAAEAHGTPAQHIAGLHTGVMHGSPGGNAEGKEVRFGIAGTALFNESSTATSTGAVNAAFDSLTGLGGAVPMANLATGEVVFGGVGSGLYVMLLYVLLAVFIGGLMVGRTPELLGKKVEAREIKLASLGILITPLTALASTALAIADHAGRVSIFNAGPQGFSETFYAYLSQSNNNGSAFAGYTGYVGTVGNGAGSHGITFADLLGSFDLAFARFVPIILVLAVAGSLAGKRVAPAGLGTMRTDNPTFVVLLIAVIILVGALTFFPALLLGPIAQSLTGHLF
jgi:potassium-transporting ATPase potassium-binding subunit